MAPSFYISHSTIILTNLIAMFIIVLDLVRNNVY